MQYRRGTVRGVTCRRLVEVTSQDRIMHFIPFVRRVRMNGGLIFLIVNGQGAYIFRRWKRFIRRNSCLFLVHYLMDKYLPNVFGTLYTAARRALFFRPRRRGKSNHEHSTEGAQDLTSEN